MTGPEHYREAQDFLQYASDRNSTDPDQAPALAIAQVHATLALAAATALKDPEGHLAAMDADAWVQVASEYSRGEQP